MEKNKKIKPCNDDVDVLFNLSFAWKKQDGKNWIVHVRKSITIVEGGTFIRFGPCNSSWPQFFLMVDVK